LSEQQTDDFLIQYENLLDLGCEILKKQGAPIEIAKQVVIELLNNEANGYDSHGLLRLLEYVSLIHQDHIIPTNLPLVNKKNKFVTEVDAQKCFGVLSANAAAKALIEHLDKNQLGFVPLINSGHLGRLWPIASSVCQAGGVLIGFSNLSGAGQNVLPFGGSDGRFCTNPIVIGMPAEPPIILDMSTSSISEGKLRKLWLRGEQAPEGWLFDKNWNSVTDPNQFYQTPKTAFLGPLGGKEFGFKGYGLALMAEIFSGILTGGGYSQPSSNKINNNAFFSTFHPELFGQTISQFQQQVKNLVEYVESSSPTREVHVPGRIGGLQSKLSSNEDMIAINAKLYAKLQSLAIS
jgi:LDH2 family malate/lactate/ureidoglycolate dehydrogenase